MYWRNIPALTVYTCLNIACVVVGSLITDVTIITSNHWNKYEGCCTPFPPEDFKNCVTQNRCPLSVSPLGFKSISCQCHDSPVTTEVRTRTRWVQTFRQCLLTNEEHRQRPPPKNKKLFKACRVGNLAAVKHIISKHPEEILSRNNKGRTPVMVAALLGMTEVFNFLACRTCAWHNTDKKGNNILHLACKGGSLDILKRVFQFADIESKGQHGRTAILSAIRKGNIDIAEFLIKAGCNITAVDAYKCNLLHMACKSRSIEALRYVTEKGILSLESRNRGGMTPLLTSVELEFLEGIKYLMLKKGCSTKKKEKGGNTILHVACRNGQIESVKLLIKHKIAQRYTEEKNDYGQSPRQIAEDKGYKNIVKLLDDI